MPVSSVSRRSNSREDFVDLAFVERKHIASFDDALLDGFGEVAIDRADIEPAARGNLLRVEPLLMRGQRLIDRRGQAVVRHRRGRLVLGDGREQGGAVARDLAGAEAADAVQGLLVDRPGGRKLRQRHVVADDVGRQLGIGGELEPQLAQGLEQRPIRIRDRDRALALALRFRTRLFRTRHARESARRPSKSGAPPR